MEDWFYCDAAKNSWKEEFCEEYNFSKLFLFVYSIVKFVLRRHVVAVLKWGINLVKRLNNVIKAKQVLIFEQKIDFLQLLKIALLMGTSTGVQLLPTTLFLYFY